MDLSVYQRLALETDETSDAADPNLIPILGLAGEAGSILSELKKARRNRQIADDHLLKEIMLVELGDVLWYTAVVAHRFNLDLNDVAAHNLKKTENLYAYPAQRPRYDVHYPIWEQLPEEFEVSIQSADDGKVALSCEGIVIGDPLTDNSYVEDGYRFHDVFHFAYAAVLGWSPVVRAIMGLKRRSDPMKDMIDDGGRAIVIEEGIAAFVFSSLHESRQNVVQIDISILQTIRQMVRGLEVKDRSVAEWREAIRQGFAIFHQLIEHDGGKVHVNTNARTLEYRGK